MTEKEKLMMSLFSTDNSSQMVDLKFFMGDDRNVTQEELCAQANKAFSQKGGAIKIDSLDKNLNRKTLSQFLNN